MGYALSAEQFLRSVAASRATLGKPPMKLLDLVDEVRALAPEAPYAVVGGLAQMLWARKTHTDDLDVALAASDLEHIHARLSGGAAPAGWRLAPPPDRGREEDDVFVVCHAQYRGVVVDLLTFRDVGFTQDILSTAHRVEALRGIRFIVPELLLVTHLLRPGSRAAVAAVELVLARRESGGLDEHRARVWAQRLGKEERFERTLRLAQQMSLD